LVGSVGPCRAHKEAQRNLQNNKLYRTCGIDEFNFILILQQVCLQKEVVQKSNLQHTNSSPFGLEPSLNLYDFYITNLDLDNPIQIKTIFHQWRSSTTI
jgi:hypothetical protein